MILSVSGQDPDEPHSQFVDPLTGLCDQRRSYRMRDGTVLGDADA